MKLLLGRCPDHHTSTQADNSQCKECLSAPSRFIREYHYITYLKGLAEGEMSAIAGIAKGGKGNGWKVPDVSVKAYRATPRRKS